MRPAVHAWRTTSAGFKKRYCVLFSSYRLLYFESEACTKRKGAVDPSVAEAVDSVSTSKGHRSGRKKEPRRARV